MDIDLPALGEEILKELLEKLKEAESSLNQNLEDAEKRIQEGLDRLREQGVEMWREAGINIDPEAGTI